jgi:hypothetical protein
MEARREKRGGRGRSRKTWEDCVRGGKKKHL